MHIFISCIKHNKKSKQQQKIKTTTKNRHNKKSQHDNITTKSTNKIVLKPYSFRYFVTIVVQVIFDLYCSWHIALARSFSTLWSRYVASFLYWESFFQIFYFKKNPTNPTFLKVFFYIFLYMKVWFIIFLNWMFKFIFFKVHNLTSKMCFKN